MKKTSLLFAALMAATLTGCGKDPAKPAKTKLYIFAAASMTETLQAIEKKYEAAHEDVDLLYNFDSSGTLKDQIIAGAKCDAFISAAQKQMNALADQKLINASTRFDFLENKVSLVVPTGNPKHVTSFDNLISRLGSHEADFKLAMGGPDVPVGDYTKKILFTYGGLNQDDLDNHSMITYGSNVKEVATQVSQGSVACGVVYRTDAYSAKLKQIHEATTEMCGDIIYPASATASTKNLKKTKAFLEYLKGEEASRVFEKVGFIPLANQ